MKSLFFLPRLAKAFVWTALAVATVVSSTGCLDRPIGREQPRTTNVIVDQLVQSAVNKIDLLFVIDNSISMADKQEILALALPDLVGRLVNPICVDAMGNDTNSTPGSSSERCPQGGREFNPIDDIHIAVVTSSLGGYGAFADCVQSGAQASEQTVDLAHLLGSLPRGGEAAPSAATSGFLRWTESSQVGDFVPEFASLVQSAGEFGCGWEATLEAWYRFLVEPYPYTKIVRQPCSASDMSNLCAGPETDGNNNLRVDQTILNQRADFLRPDSLLAVIMLSDENDCSFQASGQMWRLSQTVNDDGLFNPAFRGTAACSDPTMGPNHECCHSCGQGSVPSGCPTGTLESGDTVGAGCEDGRRYGSDGLEDHPNLRCFQQNIRFGVDYLYPVERYSNALSNQQICPFEDDLSTSDDPTVCRDGTAPVLNPLFRDLPYEQMKQMNPDYDGTPSVARPKNLIFLAGIVGVPWQDVAVSPNPGDELVYRVNRLDPNLAEEERINWSWLIGDRNTDLTGGVPAPLDPLMVESIAPRTGTNPATGENLAGTGAGYLANSINGHEWNIADNSDLQYACIFPLAQSEDCITEAEFRERDNAGEAVPNCDCTDFGGDEYQNPLCQAMNDSYDMTQRYAKAYPSLRQLQVLYDYGGNSIVASICPKETQNQSARDFGYRPAVAAIIDRLKEQLADKCLLRELSVRENVDNELEAACIIVEAKALQSGQMPSCAATARKPIAPNIDPVVRQQLEDTFQCGGNTGIDCSRFQLCEISQITNDSCLTDATAQGDGWCYVDPAKGLGSDALVEKCPPTARRKLRFIGEGTPEAGTVTFVACAGAAFADE